MARFGTNMSDRKLLVMRGVSECVTEDELDNLLTNKETPRAYVGFEPSGLLHACLLYTSPSPRDGLLSRMPSSA